MKRFRKSSKCWFWVQNEQTFPFWPWQVFYSKPSLLPIFKCLSSGTVEKVVSQSWEYDDAHDNGWIDQQSFKSTYNSPNNQLTLILAATKALPSTETLGILTWRNIL